MEKRIYSQPTTKIMSFEVYGAVCEESLSISNPIPGPIVPLYAGPDVEEPEAPLF